MTNREALLTIVGGYTTDQEIIKGFEDAGLTADATYTDAKAIDLIAINILQKLLIVSSESEGDYSRSVSTKGVERLLLMLCRKHGITLPGIGGTVKAVDLW